MISRKVRRIDCGKLGETGKVSGFVKSKELARGKKREYVEWRANIMDCGSCDNLGFSSFILLVTNVPGNYYQFRTSLLYSRERQLVRLRQTDLHEFQRLASGDSGEYRRAIVESKSSD